MGLLPIIEQGRPVACHTDWPLFYMNDFSRLGLVVQHLSAALSLLRSKGYLVHEDERGGLLEFEHRDQLSQICSALTAQEVKFEVADLVSCVYQG